MKGLAIHVLSQLRIKGNVDEVQAYELNAPKAVSEASTRSTGAATFTSPNILEGKSLSDKIPDFVNDVFDLRQTKATTLNTVWVRILSDIA